MLRKILKNSSISVISQILLMIFQFVNRRIFVMFLDIEYLGYQSVFSDIFSFLSVAELGFGEIISFHLYREVANNNTQEIGKLMYFYKWVYRIIACVIAAIGLVACAFIPFIVKDATKSMGFLYAVYLLQLLSTVCGYFLSYRRVIYVVDQKEYKTIEVDLVVKLVVGVINLITLAIFRNYILYLCIELSVSVIANVILYKKTNKDYPFLKEKYHLSREDIIKRNMVSDVKNLAIQRIGYAFYGGVDNIVVSAGCGIRTVGLLGNYRSLQSNVTNLFFYKLLHPLQAALGNIIHDDDGKKEEQWEQFKMLDIFSFFMATYLSLGFLVFFQPAIQIWMGGTEYLLPDAFVFVNAMTTYFTSLWEIVYKYRCAFGDYRQDRNCILTAAALNVILSVALVGKFGVVGVQAATLIAFFAIAYGRIRFVVRGYFGQPVRFYLFKHVGLFLVALAEMVIAHVLTRQMPVTIGWILMRFLIWGLIPLGTGCLLFFRDPHFWDLCRYVKKICNIARQRITGK